MENIVRKGEIAFNKQFLLISQCFLPYMALIFHFKCTVKCRLQFVSIWTTLKFCRLVMDLLLTMQCRYLTTLTRKAFKNMVGTEENADYLYFPLFLQCFKKALPQKTWSILEMQKKVSYPFTP